MGMTMTQKILAQAAGLTQVQAGQLIEAQLDLVLGNDITSPVAIKEMDKMKATGEVMSICNNFEGALMKAIRSLEQHVENVQDKILWTSATMMTRSCCITSRCMQNPVRRSHS